MQKKGLVVFLTVVVILALIGGFYYLSTLGIDYSKLKAAFSSQQALQEFIKSFGVWAPVLFLAIQVIQVVVSPIPGNVTGLVGGALFGWIKGFILNATGVIAGSILAFYLARFLGKSFIIPLIGKEVYARYNKVFNGKFLVGLLLIFLFPFFPDDALCFLAGLSSLPLSIFLLMVVIGRLPGMLVASLVGSGVFAFSIAEWIIIGVVSLSIFYVLFRYRQPLEEWVHSKTGLAWQEGKEAKDEE